MRSQPENGSVVPFESEARKRQLLVVYALMIASWMFDFQGSTGGVALAQAVFLSTYLALFLAFVVLDNAGRVPVRGMAAFISATAIFLFVGLVSGAANGQDILLIVRTSIGCILYVLTGYATIRTVLFQPLKMLRQILSLLCVGYVVSAVLVQRYFGDTGIDFETVRFQILGGATIPAIGYLECLLLFGLTVTEWAAMLSGFTVIFYSVTRTYLIVGLAQLASLLPGVSRWVQPKALMLGGVAAVFVVGLALSGAIDTERWTDRIFNQQTRSGGDATLYTRESEWNFMYDNFARNGTSLLFGNGMAAQTTYYFPTDYGRGTHHSTGYGHNQYISLLFIGGIIGGAGLLALQAVQFMQSLGLLMRLSRLRSAKSDVLFLAAWGAAIIIGVTVAALFSSILSTRTWALWYGLGTGLFLGGRARYLRGVAAAAIGSARPALTRGKPSGPSAPGIPAAVARRRRMLAQAVKD